jgi:predicted amidohydrolase
MARRGQDGRVEILVTPEMTASQGPDGAELEARHRPDGGETFRLLVQLEEAHERVEAWRSAAEAAKLEAAGLRAERDVAVATTAAKVGAAERIIAELRTMLDDARQPWWRRWLG